MCYSRGYWKSNCAITSSNILIVKPREAQPFTWEKKFSNAPKSWEWFWLFPGRELSYDPRNRSIGRRRHHILPGVYQSHLTRGAKAAEIPKRSNSHVLRHCSVYCPKGTHLLHPYGASAIYALSRSVICHSSVGEWQHHPHSAGTAGAYLRGDDHDLSPCDGGRLSGESQHPKGISPIG